MRLAVIIAFALLGLSACTPADSVVTPPAAPPPSPLPSNRWSDPATWSPGAIPQLNSNVLIPAGKSIVLDISPPALNRLEIDGTLTVHPDSSISLTAHEVFVGGTFRIGSEATPYLKRFVLTLTGADSGVATGNFGTKVLAVLPGATLDLHGEPRLGWTRLAATASAGSSTLALSEPVSWRPGDRVVVASTDFDPAKAEEAVVGTASPTSITLTSGLRSTHWGVLQTIAGRTVDERAEVALLTRNITIQGDELSTGGFGGHLIILAGGTAHLEGIEVMRMGQSGKVGRYPIHWHMAGTVTGQYIRDASIWKTNNRCLTIHGTDALVAQRNVCYDHLGHGYFLEDGAESSNTLEHNLGLLSRIPALAVRILPSDATPATFWITNPGNAFRDNDAAGSVGFGFWFALPASPTGLSTGAADLPRITPLGEFNHNVAHSNRSPGLQVDEGPKPDGTTETTNYAPRVGAMPNGAVAIATFQNFVGWKHSGRAVWLRGANLRLDGAVLADNMIGATFAASETWLQHALIVGESGNLTAAPSPTFPIRGYEFYDGTVGATDVTFANFVPTGARPASALGYNRQNGFSISQLNSASMIQLVNANGVYLENPLADKDGDKASLFVDADGSVTGSIGSTVVANTPFMVTTACANRAAWNSWICPYRYDGLAVQSDIGEPVAPLTIRRDDGVAVSLVGVPDSPQNAQMSVMFDRSYDITWNGTAPTRPRVTLQRANTNDGVRVSFPYPTSSFNVVRDLQSGTPLTAVATLALLDASAGDKYYWDPAAQRLYAKLLVRAGRTSTTVQVVPK